MSQLEKSLVELSIAISNVQDKFGKLMNELQKKESVNAQIIFEGKLDTDKISEIKKMLEDSIGDVIMLWFKGR